MVKYLIDTSVIARAARLAPADPVNQRLRRIELDDRYVCTPVLLELGVGARNVAEHASLTQNLMTGARRAWMTGEAEARAIEVQNLLAARGQHRSARLADLLIAAIAEANDLTVLHYDHDYDLIAGVTMQPTEWVVPRGSVS